MDINWIEKIRTEEILEHRKSRCGKHRYLGEHNREARLKWLGRAEKKTDEDENIEHGNEGTTDDMHKYINGTCVQRNESQY